MFLCVCRSTSLGHTRGAGLLGQAQHTCSTSQDNPKLYCTAVLPTYTPTSSLWRFLSLRNYSSCFSVKKWKWPPQFSVRNPPPAVFSIIMKKTMGDWPPYHYPDTHVAQAWPILQAQVRRNRWLSLCLKLAQWHNFCWKFLGKRSLVVCFVFTLGLLC